MDWIKKNKVLILKAAELALQFILSLVFIIKLAMLNILPGWSFALIIIILVALLGGIGALLFLKGKKNSQIRKLIAGIVSLVLSVVLLIGCMVVGKIDTTIDNITDTTEEKNIIAVYVRADDSAETIADAKDYVFAVDKNFDAENAATAQAIIESEVGQNLTTKSYKTSLKVVKRLLSGRVDAIIINAAYIDVMSDIKKYENVKDQLKCIYQYEVVEQIAEKDTENEEPKLPLDERPFVVYISGSDTRSAQLATSRSDVNLLMVVNPVTKQVLLLNTPRDSYVLTAKSNYTQYDKLTHCGIYGTQCSMDTLSNLYGVDVEYFTQVNFEGFSKLIDAVGGITVQSDKSFTSKDGYSYAKGTNYLNGTTALSFVRERKAFTDGDIQRGKNQMQVVEALIEKAKASPSLVTNYASTLSILEGTFATNLTSDEMSLLVKLQLDGGGDWNVVKYGVFGNGGKKTTYTVPDKKAYVIDLSQEDIDTAKELIRKVYEGETISEVE